MGSARQESSGERYIHGHHESVLRSHRWRTAENSAQYFTPVLRPDDLVLDLGCGPGTLSVDISAVSGARVIGVDNARAAIAAATAEFNNNHMVSFSVADGYLLPFADNTFDASHAHQVLQHSTQPVALLNELFRVTKKGGAVGVRDATYSHFRWSPENQNLQEWLSLYLDLARNNDGEPDAGEHLATWVTAAGYKDLHVTQTTWVFDDEATCAWWGNLWAERILSSNFGLQLQELGWATPEKLEALANAFRTWATSADARFEVPSTEVLAFK